MNNTQTKYDNIFNRDFFPTPEHVINEMQIDCRGLKVLEPSAGKGNLIDWLNDNGATEVSYCEINDDLMNICKSKARFIKNDFLSVNSDEICHINLIVMNPPFSEARKHILHAWTIAPDGCQIISLCNTDTLERWSYRENHELTEILKLYGNSFDLGQCFDNAERKTDVSVSCLHLYKPCYNDSTNFEGFYMDADEFNQGEDSILKYDEIQSLVNSYMSALICFDKFELINKEMKNICSIVGMNSGFSYDLNYGKSTCNKIDFAKELQRRNWRHIFNKMNLEKYLTSGVMKDVNKFIENQSNVPFTRRNIFKLIEIIIGTKEHNFKRALVEAIDNFTKHTDENRFGVEGWKTNNGHLLNKKFISGWMVEPAYEKGKVKLRYGSVYSGYIEDLIKVICNITGFNYNNHTSLYNFINNFKGLETNKWYHWGFFEIKGFKKGTLHFKFTDEKIWEQLNREYAKIKGQVLPEKI